jgi:tetratricopeptide (TPR) repeat protein
MSNLLVRNLKKIFPEEEYGQVVRALRNDAIVWQALQNADLAKKFVKLANTEISRWTPAFLALIALEIPEIYLKLRSTTESLDEKIKYTAAAELEQLINQPAKKTSKMAIETAGLAALAIRERWTILNETDISIFKEQDNPIIWKTITACLVGIMPSPADLLTALLTSNSQRLQTLALHAVTTNPFKQEDVSKFLLPSIANLPTIERIDILRQCHQIDPQLAKYLAGEVIGSLDQTEQPSSNPFEKIQRFVELSELLKITGEYEQAIPTLEKLWQTTTSLQTDLTAQLAQAAAKANRQETAIQAIKKISQIENHVQDEDQPNVTLAQIHTGQLSLNSLDKPGESHTQSLPSPTTLLAKAQLALKDSDQTEAQKFANQAYESTSQFLRGHDNLSTNISASITPDYLQTLIEFLIKTELVIEAGNLCELVLEKLPNNDEIVNLYSQAAHLSGDTQKALENAYVAAALAPTNTHYRRYLIELLMRQNSWEEALKEAELYISHLEQPNAQEYHLLATCYLNANKLHDAALSVQKGLSVEADNAELHALLGDIYQKDDKASEAIKHFNKAILLNPQVPAYWSNLAALYLNQDNTEKSEEMLRAAFEVIPNNPQLHLQLGQLHLENNKQAEALAEFHKAHQYVFPETPHNIRQAVYQSLGSALHTQGYHQEALKTLEEGHQAFPVNQEIAHLYGNALFKNGRYQEALSAYQIASQKTPPTVEVLLDFGRTLLVLGNKSNEALEKIEFALELDPDNQQANALLGEATAQAGDHNQAIKLYQQALQSELANDDEWLVRISTNLALSAFELNQPEIAITLLQECLQKTPDNLKVKQTLCQAYIQTNLYHNALRIVEEILDKYSQNLDILMWSSDQAIVMNDLEFAAEILNKAKQIAPQKADILVRLGYIQLENGEDDVARETFGQLFAAENVDIKNLRLAAQALIGLGDISSSIPYLEKALELSDYKSSDLLKELTNLHLKSGNHQAALETVQKQIKIQPMIPSLLVTQADILFQLSRPKAALDSMLKALELSPDSSQLHAKTAYLLRKNQDLPGSLFHMQQAMEIDDSDPKVRLRAAQVFQACLLETQALEIAETISVPDKPSLAASLLKAELLLEQPTQANLEKAEKILEKAVALSASHPRLLAIQSRIEYYTADHLKAETTFEQAMLNLAAYATEDLEPIRLSTINQSIAKAAYDLQKWDIALFFSREAQKLTPHEPYPYFLQAKIYTRRAEVQFRRDAIHMHGKPTNIIATHKVSRAAFASSAKSAEAYAPDTQAEGLISRWRLRGELSLLNTSPADYVEVLSNNPEDFAALLAAFRHADLVPNFDITMHHEDSDVIFERALLNAKMDLESSISLAQELTHLEPNNAEYAALFAILSHQNGDSQAALNGIEHALSLHPEESKWHALAGELHISFANYSAAISHFERALQIDKDNPTHLYQLGNAYTHENSPGNAIRVLEEATQIAPLEPAYWVALSKSYQLISNLDYALDSIKQAIKLSPKNISYLLMAAEIALETQDEELCERLVNQSLKIGMHNSEDIIHASELLIKLSKADQAFELISEKVELAVDKVPLQIQQALLIGIREGKKEKLKMLIWLAKENSKHPLIFSHLTDAYIDTKNPEEAIRAAQFALKHADDTLDTAHQAKLHFQLGVLFRQSGQLDQALHQLTQSLKLSPNLLIAHLEIGETLNQRKEYIKALEHFQRAIEIAPSDSRPYREAGLLLKESKDYVAAEAMFRQAYAIDSDDIFIQRQLATVIALALIHQPNANR